MIEVDLADYSMYKTYNDNYTFLLCAIDCTSKLAFVEPLKNKESRTCAEGMKAIFERSGGTFQADTCQSDLGKEFTGKPFQDFLRSKNMKFRTCRNPDTKCSIIERYIKSLRGKLQRYFTFNRTFRYLDVLQDIVHSYNHSVHSATRMKPAAVTLENAHIAVQNRKKKYPDPPSRTPKYSVGQLLRISREKGVFEKGSAPGWTSEYFRVSKISTTRTQVVYHLVDLTGEEIDGIFYEQELNPVNKNPTEEVLTVEKVLKRRGRGKTSEVFVHFKGWPSKFDRWIKKSELDKNGGRVLLNFTEQ